MNVAQSLILRAHSLCHQRFKIWATKQNLDLTPAWDPTKEYLAKEMPFATYKSKETEQAWATWAAASNPTAELLVDLLVSRAAYTDQGGASLVGLKLEGWSDIPDVKTKQQAIQALIEAIGDPSS